MRKLLLTLAAVALVAAACGDTGGDDSASAPTTATTATTAAAPATSEAEAMVADSPASVEVDDQASTGSTIVVRSVDLPAAGFVVVHADNGGKPGMVIGHSDLLPAGVSTDVVVTLDAPLEGDATVFPMAHVDANANGEYEFAPPDDLTDVPALTSDGEVAVVPAQVSVVAVAPASVEVDDQASTGSTIVVRSVDLPAAGFVVVHADNGGKPGMVIGHSDLLPAGVSTDVVVNLDAPLEGDATVFPMAHVDANANGEYEFAPPDDLTDVPALTSDGEVAVVGTQITVG